MLMIKSLFKVHKFLFNRFFYLAYSHPRYPKDVSNLLKSFWPFFRRNQSAVLVARVIYPVTTRAFLAWDAVFLVSFIAC